MRRSAVVGTEPGGTRHFLIFMAELCIENYKIKIIIGTGPTIFGSGPTYLVPVL